MWEGLMETVRSWFRPEPPTALKTYIETHAQEHQAIEDEIQQVDVVIKGTTERIDLIESRLSRLQRLAAESDVKRRVVKDDQ